jgi:carboxymethylenebutenolidase
MLKKMIERRTTEIRTADGSCPSSLFRPDAADTRPAVLFYMDGIGIRPALFEMGERLAAAGYFVLLPDLYYRAGPYEPMDAKSVFKDPAQRAVLQSRFMSTATIANVMSDTQAFLAFLEGQAGVRAARIGVTGYCLGGRMSLAAAGHFPDRIAAAASYHGANLASDAPDRPHRLASRMKARVYVAGASDDASFPDEQKTRLEDALSAAGVEHVIETYPARHGWVPSDTPAHDPAAAERHWLTLLDLLARTLRAPGE